MLTKPFRLVVSPSTTLPHPAVDAERFEALNDEELLELFLNRDDEAASAAFRAIVVRHGPMILGVCRHVLNQLQDAEDAFQATFLVLARKAGSIRDRRVLARWLYEVAYRIAMRARTNGARRRAHERQGGEMVATASIDDRSWSELRPVLHDEVNRLPEKYRLPVILCYLEGKTNEEVAQLLKWPVGTVKGRLSRARDLLRSRLTRRGLALSAVLLVTALSNGTVIADVVPARLVDATVTNALAISARRTAAAGSISPEVRRLMDFAAPPPWWSKLAVVVTLLLVIAGALASVGMAAGFPFDPGSTFRSIMLLPPGEPAGPPSPTSAGTCQDAASHAPGAP